MGWVGNNSWTHPPFFRDIWFHKTSKTLFYLLFFQYCVCYFLNIVSNPNLPTSPKNQFRDYHAWNRIEKLMPQLWKTKSTNFWNFTKHGQLVFNPWLFAEIWVSKNSGFPMDFPRIFHGFPTPPPLLEFSGRPRERPTKNVGRCGGGAGAPPRISRPGSLGRA